MQYWLNVRQAFAYMFKDNKFYQKAAFLFIMEVLMLYSSLFSFTYNKSSIQLELGKCIILGLLGLVLLSIYEGYSITNIQFLTKTHDIAVLPNLNIKKSLARGIKYLVAFALFSLPWFTLFSAFGFILGFSIMLKLAIADIFGILLFAAIIAYVFYIAYFLPASILIFAKTESCLSFYNFEEVFKIVFSNFKKYSLHTIVFGIVCIVSGYMSSIAWSLSHNGSLWFLFTVVLPAAVVVYLFFVQNYLVANIIRKED